MDLKEHIYSVLVVSSMPKFNDSLVGILPENQYSPIKVLKDVASARRHLLEKNYDIVIVNTPLTDDFGTELALDVCENGATSVMLLVKNEHFPEINARVAPYGVLAVGKPTSTNTILQSMALMCGTRERLRRMEKKASSIEEKMEEIRIVNRAKWKLIEQRNMSEQEAHRYIEKKAMDNCVTKRVIAEEILED